MNLETLPYLVPYLASMGVTFGVGVFIWRQRRNVPGAAAYALASIFSGLWIFGYIFEIITPDLDGKIFWDNFQYIGTMFLPTATLVFGLVFVRRNEKGMWRLWRRYSVIPVIIILLAFTDSLHGLMRDNPRLVPASFNNTALIYEFTPLVYLCIVYLYALMLRFLWIIGRAYVRSRSVYRTQLAIIMAGSIISLIGALLTIAGVTLGGQRDLAPLYLALSNCIIAAGMLRFQLFNLAPIARDVVFDSLTTAILVLDHENRIVDVNPAGRRMIGDSHPELIGQPLETICIEFHKALVTLRSQLGARQTHLMIENHHYDVTLATLRETHGHKVGYVMMIYDITAQVVAANELREANIELQIAWEQARKADLIKSQFLASMSHELRTPLNAILNFTEFVIMGLLGPINERQKSLLQKSFDSGKHLLSLINDVLDMTKIEAGMMRLFIENDIDLMPELENVAAAARSFLGDKPVALVLDIDANLPRIVGDRRRIRQILLNLLSNATKFTQEGTITFSVKRRGDNMVFAVIDTGPGIPPEEIDIIFEPFRQAEKSMQQTIGTGLGLPISKRLAEAHGGIIWVESQPDDGSAFYLQLPVKSTELLAMANP